MIGANVMATVQECPACHENGALHLVREVRTRSSGTYGCPCCADEGFTIGVGNAIAWATQHLAASSVTRIHPARFEAPHELEPLNRR